MIDNLYLMFGKVKWFVTNICKNFFFIKIETLRYLNKYFFRKKYNNILKTYALKIYIQ